MAGITPIPKSQKELSEETKQAYTSSGTSPVPNPKRREFQKAVKEEDVKSLSIGLRDIDEAIFFYFNSVIRPSVIQNGTKINVPVLYGSPERWASVQKDGFYRDKNGKIQVPLIMVKRDTIEKNRNIGNKLDANQPTQYGIFEKKYSTKNVYDRFTLLNNRQEVKVYQGVVIPDFVNITYSCIIFAEYVEQMNKLVEGINYASDAYWGDREKFSFRAMINSYNTTTELVKGQDRSVKTTFSITLLGHIIPDTINTELQGNRKFYSKASLRFGLETVEDITTVGEYKSTVAKNRSGSSRFYDKAGETLNLTTIEESMTAEQKTYVSLQKMYSSSSSQTTVSGNTIKFDSISFAAIPSGFPSPTKDLFQVFINGLIVESEAVLSITDSGAGVVITFDLDELGFTLTATDECTIIGKFN